MIVLIVLCSLSDHDQRTSVPYDSGRLAIGQADSQVLVRQTSEKAFTGRLSVVLICLDTLCQHLAPKPGAVCTWHSCSAAIWAGGHQSLVHFAVPTIFHSP